MRRAQLWMFLADVPTILFGLFFGLTIHRAHAHLNALTLKAEFDQTVEDQAATARLDLRVAVLQTSLLWVLILACLVAWRW